jgi:hypothetical protein
MFHRHVPEINDGEREAVSSHQRKKKEKKEEGSCSSVFPLPLLQL